MNEQNLGRFFGIGVGPGEQGLIPVIAAEALVESDIVLTPKSKDSTVSVARECISFLKIEESKFKEVGFTMSNDRELLGLHYKELGEEISDYLKEGKTVSYITLGDPFTYSTYSYTLESLKESLPEVQYRTIPGITSFNAIASACSWSIGEGKERVLILPCPDEMENLKQEISTHDVVVLMKIGKRYPEVRKLIREIGIEEHCCMGHKVGTQDEALFETELPEENKFGYFTTILIRSQKPITRHNLRK